MIDIKDYIKSNEYIQAISDNILKTIELPSKKVAVHGNLVRIVIGDTNRLSIEVVFDTTPDCFSKDKRDIFYAEGDIADRLRKEAITDTGIEFEAEYFLYNSGYKNDVRLRVNTIIKLNDKLVFPEYYCKDCDTLYGLRVFNEYPTDSDCYCPVCGNDLVKLYDMTEFIKGEKRYEKKG